MMLLPAEAQNTCRVEGQMEGFDNDTPVLVLRRTGEFTRDTVVQTVINDGKFAFDMPAEMWNEQYEIRFGSERFLASFFAEEGRVELNGDRKKLMYLEATGTLENEIWNTYMRQSRRLAQKQNKRMREIGSMQVADSVRRKLMGEAFEQNQKQQVACRDSLGKANPQSVAALYLHYQTLPMLKAPQINAILAQFSGKAAESRYYREMKQQAELLSTLSVGVEAPDFEVFTPEGGKVRLSSFRGKPLILDFWASWCAPCRKETVYIRQIYEKYHDKGLEVFSVSFDDKKAPWLKAIKDDKMTWKHGCQLLRGGKNTPVGKLYGIDGIPAIWVISPEGIILAEGLREQALVDFCDKLFGSK